MFQTYLTPAAGKRLIAKAIVSQASFQTTLASATIVIVAGTTNGLIAEEVLTQTAQAAKFSRQHFFRGITMPRSAPMTDTGRRADTSAFPGDVVLIKGQWQQGQTIFDVVDTLKEGDLIIKGANAIDPVHKRAAILIGHPEGGTILAALRAVTGRRVRLLIAAGLEKRIYGDLDALALRINTPGSQGPRLLPVPGEVITEIEAINILTGACAELVASGGVCGAEGTVWLAISGTPEQEQQAKNLTEDICKEPGFCF